MLLEAWRQLETCGQLEALMMPKQLQLPLCLFSFEVLKILGQTEPEIDSEVSVQENELFLDNLHASQPLSPPFLEGASS